MSRMPTQLRAISHPRASFFSLVGVAMVVVAISAMTATHAAPLLVVDTVTVGDPGNAAYPDSTAGAVSYTYAIGKYEVNVGQYTAFLNSVASVTSSSYLVDLWTAGMQSNLNVAGISRSGSGTGGSPYTYSVIGSGNQPIAYVSWLDAARFANWMNNGADSNASTETGAYTLNGATSGIFNREAGATWFIASRDEWTKAAYYKGGGTNAGYWLYPTQSDTAPGNVLGNAPNQGNFMTADYKYSVTQSDTYSSTQLYITDGGAYSSSASAYGTFDQAGNLWEWTDTTSGLLSKFILGGSYEDESNMSENGVRTTGRPENAWYTTGFRVATLNLPPPPSPSSVPEIDPAGIGSVVMVVGGCLGLLERRRRNSRLA